MRSGKTLRDRRNKDHEANHPENFYSTPEIFTEWLLEEEEFEGLILEPACGDGRMAEVLKAEGYHVRCSDIVDRGYKPMMTRDFFKWKLIDNIVTNPPYDLAEEFVRHALAICPGKVAMLLRLNFLESAGRYKLFRQHPPKVVYAVSQRTSMMPAIMRKNGKMKAANAVSYAWFVWERGQTDTRLRWLRPRNKITR